MKKIIPLLIFIFIATHCYPQYTVTKVLGNVKKKSTGELLKPGSKFSEGDALLWSTSKDMVRTIVAGQGVYIMTPSPKAASQGNSLLEIVKFTLHVKSNNGNLSGRSESPVLIPGVLETDEGVNLKNLISKENKYLFDQNLYDVSGGNKFFLQTEIPGNKPVIKSLQTVADTLILYLSDFKKINDADAEKAKYSLGFFSKQNNSSQLLIKINPYFDSTQKMESIMKIIISADKKTAKETLKDECYAEVYEDWGKPSNILFKDTFEKIYDHFSMVDNKK